MQAQREVILTIEGYKKIEDELKRLKTVNRKQVADRMREALEIGGDLTDNSEIEGAKNEHAFVEGRIDELRDILGIARVLQDDEVETDVVGIGSIVQVKDLENNDDWEWYIVGTFEADPSEDKISNESPVGEALMGKKVGEIVDITIPAGMVSYQILNIRK